jgi:putative transposase
MAFKLLTMAQQRWRRLNAPHLVAHLRAGVRFRDGLRVERDTATEAVQTAA